MLKLTGRTIGIVLAAGALAVTAADAGAQVVQGTVLDAASGAGIAGAEVTLLTPRLMEHPSVTTDSTGTFLLRAPRPGVYRLRVVHVLYAPFESDSVEVSGGEALMLEIRLSEGAVALEPLIVTARRNPGMPGFDERQAAGLGRFITREEIDRRSAFRASDLLRNVQGVVLRRVAGSDGMAVMMRGGGVGECEPSLWVDGVLVRQVPGSTFDQFLNPALIEAIEVYASLSTAPPQYTVGGCGAIVVWTRRGSAEEGRGWSWKKLLAGMSAALVVVWLIAS